MATLAITEKSRQAIGNRLRVTSEITVGAAATALTVTAASLGLSHIDSCLLTPGTVTSADIGDWHLSTASGPYIDITLTSADVGDVFGLMVVGF